MANKYSSLYNRGANSTTGPFSYNGATAYRPGDQISRVAVLGGAVANNDVLYLAGGFAPGEIIIAVDLTHSGDSNITSADLVLRPRDGTADIVLVAASAVLDGTVNTSITFAQMAGNVVPDNGKDYDLCFVAKAAGSAVNHVAVVRSAL